MSLQEQSNRLGNWQRQFKSHSGEIFGGTFPIDYEKTDFLRDCLKKIGGAAESAVDLGSYEGYHSIQLAGLPGMKRVIGLEGRDSNIARANFANKHAGSPIVSFHQYDLENIGTAPLPVQGPFDIVWCAGLLYHMSKPWEVMRWMSEISAKYLFLDTHYGEMPLYRCGPYLGEKYIEMDTETCGTRGYAFWPMWGDLIAMMMQNSFAPRFMYQFSAGHHFQPRTWIFAEKSTTGATLNGINPLRPDAKENFPSLDDGPQPSAFHGLQMAAHRLKNGQPVELPPSPPPVSPPPSGRSGRKKRTSTRRCGSSSKNHRPTTTPQVRRAAHSTPRSRTSCIMRLQQ